MIGRGPPAADSTDWCEPADRGQRAVAEAEEAAFGGTDLDAPEPRAELERVVRDVTGGPWWASCGPPVRVVTPRSSARSSSARGGPADASGVVEIRLTDEQLTMGTVAHELAHALAGVAHGHGPRYRRAAVDVTALLAGADAAERLADAFGSFGVPAGTRAWPSPYRAEGATFRMVP